MPEYIIELEIPRTDVSSLSKFYGKEVAFFSDRAGTVTLDKEQFDFYSFSPPNSKCFANPFGWNTKLGYKNYTPKIFKSHESTIDNFLKSLVQISKVQNSGVNLSSYKVFCPSSFFQYVSVKRQSGFFIMWYNNRYIIANNETREGQNVLMSYAGIRFEDLLTHGTSQKTINNYNLYQSVIETKIDGMSCLYCAEIDSYDKESGAYTEIKMILCKSNIPHAKTTNKKSVLESLSKGNVHFGSFLFRLLIQCKFANDLKVVIGIRDQSFTIRNITDFSVKDDLLPFFHQLYPDYYEKYMAAVDLIRRVFHTITKRVTRENPVFYLEIGSQYILKSVDSMNERCRILKRFVPTEFINLIDSFD